MRKLLVSHCTCFGYEHPLSLKEITEREEALRQEIAEREHLLAAYQLIRAEREQALGLLKLAPAAPPPDAAEPCASTAEVVATIPEVNLHLEALSRGHGGTGRAIIWVLRQMTADFTVHDVAAALGREGCPIAVPKIAVILNRMKNRWQITEIRNGRGRTPSMYRAVPAPPPLQIFWPDEATVCVSE